MKVDLQLADAGRELLIISEEVSLSKDEVRELINELIDIYTKMED